MSLSSASLLVLDIPALLMAGLVVCTMKRRKISPLKRMLFVKREFALMEDAQALGFLVDFFKSRF